jgi:hypothetical protein
MESVMHTFNFTFEVERDEETVELEIEYTARPEFGHGYEVEIASVLPDIALTDEEEKAIYEKACDSVSEDISDAADEEADYRYEDMRDSQMDW